MFPIIWELLLHQEAGLIQQSAASTMFPIIWELLFRQGPARLPGVESFNDVPNYLGIAMKTRYLFVEFGLNEKGAAPPMPVQKTPQMIEFCRP